MIGKIVLTMLVAAAKINQSSIVPAFDQTRVPQIIKVPTVNHPALALFAQRTRIPTSARSIGSSGIWDCLSSSTSSYMLQGASLYF